MAMFYRIQNIEIALENDENADTLRELYASYTGWRTPHADFRTYSDAYLNVPTYENDDEDEDIESLFMSTDSMDIVDVVVDHIARTIDFMVDLQGTHAMIRAFTIDQTIELAIMEA